MTYKLEDSVSVFFVFFKILILKTVWISGYGISIGYLPLLVRVYVEFNLAEVLTY